MKSGNNGIIEQLNQIKFCGFGDIKFGSALSCRLKDKTIWKESRLDDLSNYFSEISDYKIRYEGDCSVCFVLSSYNIPRHDQTVMFENVTGILKNKMVIEAIEGTRTADLSLIALVPIWYCQLSKIKVCAWKKKMIVMYMYHNLIEALAIVKIIKKRRKNIKLVSVFDDIFGIDNIVVQICKKMGKKTSTFHHAIINGSFDYIEYKYSPSDYFLAWGEYTRDMAMKYGMDKNKIKVLGPLTKLCGNNSVEPICTDRRIIGVLTRGTIGDKYASDNVELIKIINEFARKYDYKYIIRLHPSDRHKYGKYIDDKLCSMESNSKRAKDTLQNFINNVDFVVCGNSSVYADALDMGKMAFRYIPENEYDEDVCKGIDFGRISSLEQLENIYNSEGIHSKKIEEISNYIYKKGDIASNYSKFFEKFS
jgi:hypothetical protein